MIFNTNKSFPCLLNISVLSIAEFLKYQINKKVVEN